ncbi:MAG TPA: formyltetrahydrofolate deformylase [Gammaproteobacteria bacterium]|nr:formyltetrahydrofolate deformylase [Gammaproteobacteria bacterium]
MKRNSATLLIHCPDQKGIVISVTEFIFKNGGNIIHLAQHVDAEKKVFFMRIEWDLSDFAIANEKIAEYFKTLVGKRFAMNAKLHFSTTKQRMALFVSKLPHCFYDILARVEAKEWQVEIPLIISNHRELAPVAARHGIDFHYFPISKENKAEQETAQLALLKKAQIDFVVLARYMQILSDDFVSALPNQVINIHHSFLPAFAGAKPYHAAYARGVKIIGATSHYVTAELDAGPIIEQDVANVSHEDSVNALVRKGRDLEKIVLSRAIWNHLRNNVLVYGNKTVIF